MLDFYEVWGKEVLKKRIATFFAFLFGFLFFFNLIWGFLTEAPPKTVEDYAYRYAVDRFNYLPSTVEKAYFSRYQYKFTGYDILVEKEIEEIRKFNLVSFFKPVQVRRDPRKKNTIYVKGIRVTGKLRGDRIEDVEMKVVTVVLRIAGKGFTVEKIE